MVCRASVTYGIVSSSKRACRLTRRGNSDGSADSSDVARAKCVHESSRADRPDVLKTEELSSGGSGGGGAGSQALQK